MNSYNHYSTENFPKQDKKRTGEACPWNSLSNQVPDNLCGDKKTGNGRYEGHTAGQRATAFRKLFRMRIRRGKGVFCGKQYLYVFISPFGTFLAHYPSQRAY